MSLQVINTNIMSLNAQRQLNKSALSQQTAIERLSSGLRINNAKDDAAGLAISTRFETQTRGLNQAVRNANDGISLAQTAEGSMSEMSSILQRMRELAVQSANDSNSDADRVSLQSEVDQLYFELDRISNTSEFNGVKLLDGTGGSRSLQVGANANQTIDFKLTSVTTTALNLNGFSALGDLNSGRINSTNLLAAGMTVASGAITVNGIALGSFSGLTSNTLSTVESFFNTKTAQTGVTATAYNSYEGGGAITGVTSGALIINSNTVTKSASITELVDNINRDVAGVSARLSNEGGLILSNDTGNSITVASATASDLTDAGLTAGTYSGYLGLKSNTGEAVSIAFDKTLGTIGGLQAFGLSVSNGADDLEGGAVSGTYIQTSDLIKINDVNIGEVKNGISSAAVSAADIAFSINAVKSSTGVSATASTVAKFSVVTSLNRAQTNFSINGVTVSTVSATSMSALVTQINSAGIQGVVAEVEASTGYLKLTSNTGVSIDVLASDGVFVIGDLGTSTAISITANVTIARGNITLAGEDGKHIRISSGSSTESGRVAAIAKLGLVAQGGSATAIGLGLSVSDKASANNAIERIDEALGKLSSNRGALGALQNRLGSTISNLENVSQNLSAANSRVRDADFASETANLTKSQILQQAGIAMLAQANQSGQGVLSLLG